MMENKFYYRKLIVSVIAGTILHGSLLAQNNKPLPAVTQPPAAPGTPVSFTAYTNPSVNYVRTWDAIGPQQDPNVFSNGNYTQVKQTTAYIDGLARPLQVVAKQATAGSAQVDIVSPVVYDQYGREAIKYMPHVSTENNGSFKIDPFGAYGNGAFMQTHYPGETFFYSKTDFEASPLNRPLKNYAPGNSWSGTNRGSEQVYSLNSIYDDVKIWTIPNESDFELNIPSAISIYILSLYKNITKDEEGNAVVEYKDKEGKVILKKVQSGTVPADYSGYDNWLCTYYVYDEHKSLRFVIPPKAVAALAAPGVNWLITPQIANELCFRYEYDYRQRMIAKKVPGAGWVYMLYDKRDRLVYTQDANMRAKNHWLATLYDELNRPVLTGMLTYTGTQASLQAGIDAAAGAGNSSVSVTRTYNSSTITPQLVIRTDQPGTHTYEASNQIDWEEGFDTDNTTDLLCQITAAPAPSNHTESVQVSDNPLPNFPNFTALSITYYDNYDFNTSPVKNYSAAHNANIDDGGNLYAEALPAVAAQAAVKTRGMVTGTRVLTLPDPNNLASGNWLSIVNFYDHKGRLIQTNADNAAGGTDVLTNRYNFTNQVITSYLLHNNPQNADASLQTIRTKTNILYDHGGRLLQIDKTINDDLAGKHRIAKMEYDAFGQLNKKWLGQDWEDNVRPIEELLYEYNIRGWLKGINKGYANNTANSNASPAGPWFGMELNYDWGFTTNQYNGNIAGTRWRSKGDGMQRAYGYGYDKVNRLMYGDFAQGSSYTDDPLVNFDMKMGDGSNSSSAYDENGNIKRMQHWGLTIASSTQIDDLQYTYDLNGSGLTNKLKNVIDLFNTPDTKLGDFRSSQAYITALGAPKTAAATDYTYDVNGNLTKDLNKDIEGVSADGIIYNHLNLPWKINVKNKGSITYIYDAAGIKLKKITEEPAATISYNGQNYTSAVITTTSYLTGAIYEKKEYSNAQLAALAVPETIQFMAHEEGRTRIKPALGSKPVAFLYDFMVKDHLGNVRAVLTDQPQTPTIYQAGMETALHDFETKLFNHIPETRDNKPAGPQPDNIFDTDGNNQKVSKLFSSSGTDKRVGPGVVLKVMTGDKFKASGFGWYRPGTDATVNTNGLPALLNVLLSSLESGIGGIGKVSATQLNAAGVLNAPINQFLPSQPPPGSGVPKAYLNWVLLDEEMFGLVTANGNTGALPIPAITGTMQKQLMQANGGNDITVSKNGYLYVYVSNESAGNVFFDDLRVEHIKGSLIEETHYYPFGLTMAGISSKAASTIESNAKFNGIEFNNHLDLNMYDAFYRNLDPQIGRFLQIDPRPNEMISLYSAMNNDPILYTDPLGDTTWIYDLLGNQLNVINSKSKNQIHYIDADKYNELETKNTSLGTDLHNAGDPVVNNKQLEKDVRKQSSAFFGSKSASDLQKILNDPKNSALNSDGNEALFVARISKSRELRFSQVFGVQTSERQILNPDKQIDKFLSNAVQASLFGSGHSHTYKGFDPTNLISTLRTTTMPTSRYVSLTGQTILQDFNHILYRSSTGSKSQHALFIAARVGFSTYSSGENSAYPTPGKGMFFYSQFK